MLPAMTSHKGTSYTLLDSDGRQRSGSFDADDARQNLKSPPRRSWTLLRRSILVLLFVFSSILASRFYWPHRPSHRLEPLADSTFNYNAYYGIPATLPSVSSQSLMNRTELDLNTGFKVSSTPTTRSYTFNVTQALAAPDGYQKPMILVNGHFPGPLIEANTGDTIRIIVNNKMSNWSTTIHWHGIDQKNTTWMDGVAAVSQCGIPPGSSFIYEFKVVAQRGTYWYHAHLSVQYTDGLFGPIVIHDPGEQTPAVDGERIMFIGDWYHTYGSVLDASYLNPGSRWVPNVAGVEPIPDGLLINGQNIYNCSVISSTFPPNYNQKPTPQCASSLSAGLYQTKVQSNKAYRLRLINHGSLLPLWFSVDNHTLEIVEMDGVEIEPVAFRGVQVNIGQRYSVIIRTNQTVGNYNIRASVPRDCYLPILPYQSTGLLSEDLDVVGVLSYDNVNPNATTIGVPGDTTNPYVCSDMPFDMPKPRRSQAAYNVSSDSNSFNLEFSFRQSQNLNRIFVNRTAWSPLETNATLWRTIGQDFSQPPNIFNSWNYSMDQQVLVTDGANEGVQLAVSNLEPAEHPWHLHGHDFQVVGWGDGVYGQGKTTWNLANPMRRDTVTLPALSHFVLRWATDNPGLWSFHCHIAWHIESGMFLQFLERPTVLQSMLAALDPTFKRNGLAFCPKSTDQSFGTEAEYRPADLVPSASVEGTRRLGG